MSKKEGPHSAQKHSSQCEWDARNRDRLCLSGEATAKWGVFDGTSREFQRRKLSGRLHFITNRREATKISFPLF